MDQILFTPEQFVGMARRRNDTKWVFFQIMDSKDRKAFDAWLLEIDDPLVYQAGTTETRFADYVRRG